MPFQRGQPRPVLVPFALAKSVAEDDFVGVDGTGQGFKASEQAFVTDLPTTRAAFVVLFAGASNQAKDAGLPILWQGGALAGKLKIDSSGVRTYKAVAGTYKVGDLVGPTVAAGPLLDNQTVEGVASNAQAVGRVVGRAGVLAAGALLEVDILSNVFPAAK